MITEGYLVRHYQGAAGARDAALLDVAQDHPLMQLYSADCSIEGWCSRAAPRCGNFGPATCDRFSTDLDFSAPDEALALDALAAVDGAELFGFRFAVDRLGDDGRRGDILVDTPFGRPNLGAKIEVSRHPLALPPERRAAVALPIHRQYDFTLPELPVVRTEEAIAEKLARFRRVSLARDLFDLQWFVMQRRQMFECSSIVSTAGLRARHAAASRRSRGTRCYARPVTHRALAMSSQRSVSCAGAGWCRPAGRVVEFGRQRAWRAVLRQAQKSSQ